MNSLIESVFYRNVTVAHYKIKSVNQDLFFFQFQLKCRTETQYKNAVHTFTKNVKNQFQDTKNPLRDAPK